MDDPAMNELSQLQSMGFILPSPAYLLGSILFGLVGLVGYRQGRATLSNQLTWTSVALMVYPYAVSDTWMLWAAGVLLCLWLAARWQ